MTQSNTGKLAHSIEDVTKITGLGRSYIYEVIKAGNLRIKKAGRRSLVLDADLNEWLTGLPEKVQATPESHDVDV